MAGIPLDRAVLAEVVTTLGSVPIAEYATPSTKELPEAVRKYVKAHDGMLLANHGALTLGADLFSAYYKMETIEHFANISFVARMLGGERLLSRDEVDAAAGTARHVTASRRRRRSAPIRDRGRGRRSADCQVCLRRRPMRRRAARAATGIGAGRCRRGNSANIPRTHGIDRGCGQESEVELAVRSCRELIAEAGQLEAGS